MKGQTTVLPYRADADELLAWIEGRARGRGAGDRRAGVLSAKSAEGLALTATLLGFVADDELSALGQELALADAAGRRGLIRGAVLDFLPYRQLITAIRDRGQSRVEASWIEAWWATHGFGSSPSNRQEAVAVLGHLTERAGLGSYIPGRRGHPTRIEWNLNALGDLESRTTPQPPEPESELLSEAPAAQIEPAPPLEPEPSMNRVVVSLAGGRTAHLELPARLPRSEKRRLIDLLDLLVADE